MKIAPAVSLEGHFAVPGDKSISHRALLFGAISDGETHVRGWGRSGDTESTLGAVRAVGARVDELGPDELIVHGVGLRGLQSASIECNNAGTLARLIVGLLAFQDGTFTLTGDESLSARPMERVAEPLRRMGAQIETTDGHLPLTITGGKLEPIDYELPVASAQIKSAILLAGLNTVARTTIIEREASRDHTEKMLAYFGAEITSQAEGDSGRRISLNGRPELVPAPIVVPADPSSAAFALVAALIVPGSDVLIEGVMLNPLRTGLLTTLREMGAQIQVLERRSEGGEEVADLRVCAGPMRGVDVPASRAPSMIDEYPILAIAAAFAHGDTHMRGLSELRVKESDRLAAVAAGLAANGVQCEMQGDDLIVRGGAGRVAGNGLVATHLDHRIAMSFLVMGLAAERAVAIDDERMIDTSFPTFRPLMSALGAEFA
jgi:3-phosphoshikimate 1-carboxyvinyltransferase